MADKPYRDPKTTKIEDWKWNPLEPVQEKLGIGAIPDYIQKGFGGFMNEQAGRSQRGEMTPRDLIKAYTIAQSSIGRGGLSHATASKTGMKLPNTGGEVRPEGSFSEWLGSREGQQYLDAAERGEIHPSALEDIRAKFAPFGKQNAQVEAMKYAANEFPAKAKHLNAALTGHMDKYRDFAEQLKGIAGAKSGFIGSLLGRGDLPTLDARQLNLHAAKGPAGVGSMMARGKGTGAREAVDRLASRQSAMGFGVDPDLIPHYQHLAHHAVWDKASGTETTHDDLMRAMRGYAEGGNVNPTVEQMRRAIEQASTSAGMKSPVVANKALTGLKDFHQSLGDAVQEGVGRMKAMVKATPFKYEVGHRIFTKGSAEKNREPYEITARTMVGNQPMRHPAEEGKLPKVMKHPETGETMRTPYEPGYWVRQHHGDGEYSEYTLPEKAILGHLAAGGQPEKASEALGQHEGKTLMVTQADRTKVGGGYLGGPGFSSLQHTDPEYAGKAWGVMTPGMAATILGSNRRVPEGEALWSTLIGTPEQHSSNQMVFDKLLHDFKKAAKAGLLTPEQHARINARLSAIADKEGKPFFGEGADIMNKKTTGSADTFAKRRIIGDLIGGHGVGGKKGQIGNYDKIMRNTTEPELRDAPTHAIGPRLFNLSGETSNRPDLHPAFPQLLHGEDYGQMYHPVPKDVMLRDYMRKFLAEKGRTPGYMDMTLGYSPTQHLSEDFLTHLQKHGYADGGEVSQDEMLAHVMLHKADGGAITPDAPDMPDGTSTDVGYYEGGPSDGALMDPMQYHADGGSIKSADIGVEEAPDMPVKLYMPPGKGGMPVGGVDFQPEVPGQQMAAPPSQGQPPQGAGMPQMGQAPAMPPTGGAGAPTGPQSNILQMTPQGQAMSAMKATPAMKKGGGVKLTTEQMKAALKHKKAAGGFEGGKISDIGITERPL